MISLSGTLTMKRVLPKIKKYISRLGYEIKGVRTLLWIERSKNYLANGAVDQALSCLKRSLAIDNNLTSAYSLMAEILLEGDNYISVLSQIHQYLKPETYVEIGVHKGKSIALAHPSTKKIGIDPFPCIDRKLISPTKLYPITSDDFFSTYNLFEELHATKLSLAFIDGLHQSEQVLKDFINLERYSNEETVIILHDCLPITRLVATRIRYTDFWTGDVWKVVPFLIENRPDLVIHLITAPPSGLCIITNLDSSSTLLSDKYSEFVSEYQEKYLPYNSLDSNEGELFKKTFKIVPGKWDHIVGLV